MGFNNLKQQVKEYWNKHTCGTSTIKTPKFTREYFEEIEEHRYKLEPEIFSFAQFTRYSNKKVLEVGVGAGTDFVQWVRAGAQAYGIDLTESAIEHTKHRLELLGLKAEELRVADAENLPYEDNYFDLVYSWGVIHHTPDTKKALHEIVRVTKIGGKIKIMIYNKRSIYAMYKYLKYGLLKGKPFVNIDSILYHHQESPGTKAYTRHEFLKLIDNLPVKVISMKSPVTVYDLEWNLPCYLQFFSKILSIILGYRNCGWFLMIEMEKAN